MDGALVGLDHREVVRLFGLDQPGQAVLDGVQGIEGGHGVNRIQLLQERAEVADLAGLGTHLDLGKGDRQAVRGSGPRASDAGALWAGRAFQGLAVDGDRGPPGCGRGPRFVVARDPSAALSQVGAEGVAVDASEYAADGGPGQVVSPSQGVGMAAERLQQVVGCALCPSGKFVYGPGASYGRAGANQQMQARGASGLAERADQGLLPSRSTGRRSYRSSAGRVVRAQAGSGVMVGQARETFGTIWLGYHNARGSRACFCIRANHL